MDKNVEIVEYRCVSCNKKLFEDIVKENTQFTHTLECGRCKSMNLLSFKDGVKSIIIVGK